MGIGIREASMSGCCIINTPDTEASQNGSRTSSNRRAPERRKLHRLKRQATNQVNSSHARIVLFSSGGVANREIARLVDRTPQWVRQIIHRFNWGGVEAIEWYPYWHVDNTPHKFFADVVEQIAEVALSSAKSLIGMTQWSLSKSAGVSRQPKDRRANQFGLAPYASGAVSDSLATHQDVEGFPRPRISGRNTGESAVSTSIAPREGGESASMNSVL